jgi:hypothetical protein
MITAHCDQFHHSLLDCCSYLLPVERASSCFLLGSQPVAGISEGYSSAHCYSRVVKATTGMTVASSTPAEALVANTPTETPTVELARVMIKFHGNVEDFEGWQLERLKFAVISFIDDTRHSVHAELLASSVICQIIIQGPQALHSARNLEYAILAGLFDPLSPQFPVEFHVSSSTKKLAATWTFGPWTDCADAKLTEISYSPTGSMCGKKESTRTVECFVGNGLMADPKACDADIKPIERKRCWEGCVSSTPSADSAWVRYLGITGGVILVLMFTGLVAWGVKKKIRCETVPNVRSTTETELVAIPVANVAQFEPRRVSDPTPANSPADSVSNLDELELSPPGTVIGLEQKSGLYQEPMSSECTEMATTSIDAKFGSVRDVVSVENCDDSVSSPPSKAAHGSERFSAVASTSKPRTVALSLSFDKGKNDAEIKLGPVTNIPIESVPRFSGESALSVEQPLLLRHKARVAQVEEAECVQSEPASTLEFDSTPEVVEGFQTPPVELSADEQEHIVTPRCSDLSTSLSQHETPQVSIELSQLPSADDKLAQSSNDETSVQQEQSSAERVTSLGITGLAEQDLVNRLKYIRDRGHLDKFEEQVINLVAQGILSPADLQHVQAAAGQIRVHTHHESISSEDPFKRYQ